MRQSALADFGVDSRPTAWSWNKGEDGPQRRSSGLGPKTTLLIRTMSQKSLHRTLSSNSILDEEAEDGGGSDSEGDYSEAEGEDEDADAVQDTFQAVSKTSKGQQVISFDLFANPSLVEKYHLSIENPWQKYLDGTISNKRLREIWVLCSGGNSATSASKSASTTLDLSQFEKFMSCCKNLYSSTANANANKLPPPAKRRGSTAAAAAASASRRKSQTAEIPLGDLFGDPYANEEFEFDAESNPLSRERNRTPSPFEEGYGRSRWLVKHQREKDEIEQHQHDRTVMMEQQAR